jgi:hypothetical protein
MVPSFYCFVMLLLVVEDTSASPVSKFLKSVFGLLLLFFSLKTSFNSIFTLIFSTVLRSSNGARTYDATS